MATKYKPCNYPDLLESKTSTEFGWQTLYDSSVIKNHHGNIHSERSAAISRWLCEEKQFKQWSAILKNHAVKRTGTYNVEHDCVIKNENSGRDEEHIGMAMCKFCRNTGKEVPGIGKVLNYQIPLKNNDRARPNIGTAHDENHGIGKAIDMVALKNDKLFLYEMKVKDSSETMMRCLLESFTYAKSIKSLDKFKEDLGVPRCKRIVIAPLCFKGGRKATPYNDALDMEKNPDLDVWTLISKMRKDVSSWADIEIVKIDPVTLAPEIARWI